MKMQKSISITQTLKSCGFLAAVGDDVISKIAKAASVEHYDRGDLIFPEGAECRGMYIVADGAVKIYKIGPDGREHVLHVAEPGDAFGEVALFLGSGYPAYASAVKNSSVVLLRKTPFLELLKTEPDLCFRLLASMSVWAHKLVGRMELLTLRDASARLADYLLSKAKGDGAFELSIPKQTLAAHLDIAGETLSRLLNRFEAQGMIEVIGRSISIKDRDALKEVSESEA